MSPSFSGDAPAIQVCGAVKHYGAVRAVDGVDLSVQRGEMFGLIGHNGAGKSTLFKMMLGLIAPSSGEIRVAGARVGDADFREARRRIGYLPENVVLWDNLSGLETLTYFARLKGAALSECQPLLDRVGLGPAGARAVREYSKGMRQRLGFAQALLGGPQVLFLDEPTSGLDPMAIHEFYDTLRDLRSQGVTMLVTSHILAELQERVDRLAILADGRVQAQGSVQALRAQCDLPLTLQLTVEPGHRAEVAGALAAVTVPGGALESTGQGWRWTLPRAAKMTALQAIALQGERVSDLRIDEPSLEDLFVGMRREAP